MLTRKQHNPYILLALGSVTFLILYLCARLYFFFTTGAGFPDATFAFFILLAEGYSLFHAFGYVLGVYRLERHPIRYRRARVAPDAWPEVALLVPTRNEPLEVLEQTLISLAALDYPNKRMYLVDGSSDVALIERVHLLCDKFGVVHVLPRKDHASKAGAVNEFIRTMDEPFVAIFDADQRPMPHFLTEVVPLILADERIAYVQTPQLYANFSESTLAKGAAMQHSIFYEIVCEAKQATGAAFCCGTNVLLRVAALRFVGGFDEKSVTEDFATSLSLHIAGYKSVYYNHVLAFGMAPVSLSAYLTQQTRWATGTIGVLRPLVRAFLTNPHALRPVVWWEYFLSSTYYFIGWAFLILVMGPVVFLLTGFPTYFSHPLVYLGTFLPYLALNVIMFLATLGRRKYTFGNLIYGIILGSLSFPVLIRASLAGLRGTRVRFAVTPKGGSARLPFWKLWPWHLLVALNGAALVVGSMSLTSDPYPIGVNMLWCVYHLVILVQLYRLNEDTRIARG